MATTDDSYHRLLADYRARDNYDAVFRSTLDDLVGKMDLSWVKSCIAFGAGSGEHEIEFVRRFLPNLFQFVGIDPDHASITALRSNFQNAGLPGVQAEIVETTVENWKGVEKPVDAALFFNAIYHVPSDARQQLLRKLRAQYLNPDGVVIMIENGSPLTSGYIRLMHRLGYAQDNWHDDIKKEVLQCGFRLDSVHDIVSTRDLSAPTDGVVKYVELLFENTISGDQVRAAIDDIYSDPDPQVKQIVKKLATFRKS